jgi:hypothetical protein
MVADFMTKPLQGSLFRELRDYRKDTKGGRTQREEGHKGRGDMKRGRRGGGTMDCPNKGDEIT